MSEELTQIEELLRSLGYIQGNYSMKENKILAAKRRDIIFMKMNLHQTYPFLKLTEFFHGSNVKNLIEVDLNMTIFRGGSYKDPISLKDILALKKEIISDSGIPYYVLDSNYMVIQLIFHLFREIQYTYIKESLFDITLMKLLDIKQIIERNFFDSEINNFIDLIKTLKIDGVCYLVFSLVGEIFDTPQINMILKKIMPIADEYIRKTEEYKRAFYDSLFKRDFNR